MGWTEFALIGIGCALTILIFRTVPLFALRGRELPGWLSQALAFIPPAAFAALIANDIFSPGMFDAGLWPAMIPVIAALIECRRSVCANRLPLGEWFCNNFYICFLRRNLAHRIIISCVSDITLCLYIK